MCSREVGRWAEDEKANVDSKGRDRERKSVKTEEVLEKTHGTIYANRLVSKWSGIVPKTARNTRGRADVGIRG